MKNGGNQNPLRVGFSRTSETYSLWICSPASSSYYRILLQILFSLIFFFTSSSPKRLLELIQMRSDELGLFLISGSIPYMRDPFLSRHCPHILGRMLTCSTCLCILTWTLGLLLLVFQLSQSLPSCQVISQAYGFAHVS